MSTPQLDGILVKINHFDVTGKDFTPDNIVQFPFPKEAETEVIQALAILHAKYTQGVKPQ